MFVLSRGWIFALWKDFLLTDFYDTHPDMEFMYSYQLPRSLTHTRFVVSAGGFQRREIQTCFGNFPWIKYQFFTNESERIRTKHFNFSCETSSRVLNDTLGSSVKSVAATPRFSELCFQLHEVLIHKRLL